MNECSICQSEIKDKINMSCGSQHAFCFYCILKSVEVSNGLRNCPLCNGGDKFIIIDINLKKEETDDYYSIYSFNMFLPTIKKIIKDKSHNTCVVSEKILLFYIKNKIQLEFFRILNKDHDPDEIIKYIKWEHTHWEWDEQDVNSIFVGLAGEASNFFLGSNNQRNPNVRFSSYFM